MKTIIYFFLFLSCLLSEKAFSQACTGSCDVTINVSGTNNSSVNLNIGESVCVTGSGTYSGSINTTSNIS